MIFPKQQMSTRQLGSEPIKKQALQLIIDLYLNRKADEDIQFLSRNFGTTQSLVASIGSSQLSGLTSVDVGNSKLIYGQNEKKAPFECLTIAQCFGKQVGRPCSVMSFIFLLSSLIFGAVMAVKQLWQSSLIIMVATLGFILLRALTLYFMSQQLSKSSLAKTKNNIYSVIRNGNYAEVQQSELVVGDIVELGFKQIVPATGILISSTQIFVKESKKDFSTQIKLNLEQCLSKMSNMSILDLKLSFEQSTLPSPIVLRGSQLTKGTTYTILVISVTEDELLNKWQIKTRDKLESTAYMKWMNRLQSRWMNWSFFLGILVIIFLTFGSITESRLYFQNQPMGIQIFFRLQLKLSVLILVMNVDSMVSFLNIVFMKLMNQLKIMEGFQNFFGIRRILCNQKKIVQSDKINALQLAVCDKTDLISLPEAFGLHPSTLKMIEEIKELFNLSCTSQNGQPKLRKYKCRRIVYANKKQLKIISIVSASNYEKNDTAEAAGPISKINGLSNIQSKLKQHRSTLVLKKDDKKQKRGSEKVTKLLKIHGELNQIENLKQIIHSRCRVKSQLVLDGLAGLAQNGLKTYYYQNFDLKNMQQMTHVLIEGRIKPLQTEFKQRLVVLSRKMSLVYGLTPIMISYNEGSINSASSRVLICIVGVNIEQNNQIIQELNRLEQAGIKSTIIINKQEQNEYLNSEQAVISQYLHRKWIQLYQSSRICDATSMKHMLKRLVCKECLIANCDCKEKVEVVPNIQPFLQVSKQLKIIYNLKLDDFRTLQCAYRQIQNNLICLNSHNSSASDYISSIFSCQHFITKLRKSLIFFYAVTTTYFLSSLIFWIRNIEPVSPVQIGVSYILVLAITYIAYLFQAPAGVEKVGEENGKIRIVSMECVIMVYAIVVFAVLGSQFLYLFLDRIPEYQDNYDTLLEMYGMDLSKCKYGPNHSLSGQFVVTECSTPEVGLQYSRISTIITAYLYFTVWSLSVLINRSFKSLWALISYTLSISIFVLVVEKGSWIIHGYSYGLAWQHYLIVGVATVVTLAAGGLVGLLVCKIPMLEYFRGQVETCISFSDLSQSTYISKLKLYEHIKKRQKQASKKQYPF